jgi:hypothetical protein
MSAGLVPGPEGKTEIRLAREDLDIEVTRVASIVKAAITLENTGAATKLQVGFPCEKGLDPGIASLDCKTPIKVLVDGKKVKAKRKGKAWVWPMKLAAGQTVALEVSYTAPLRNDRYEDPFNGMGAVHYRLVTGAAWAGPIGELVMRVKLPTESVVFITPAGYTRSRNHVEWTLKDFEPTGDLVIVFHPRFVGRKQGTPDEARALAKDLRARTGESQEWVKTFRGVFSDELALPAMSDKEVAETVEASARLLEATP